MRITSVTIKNVRSFKEETTVNFDEHFNILIGPNGSGKSNLLDIVNIALREYILCTYVLDTSQTDHGFVEDVRREYSATATMQSLLGKYSGDNSDMLIRFSLCITKDDVANINTLRKQKDNILSLFSKYRNIDGEISAYINRDFNFEEVVEGKIVEYSIRNYSLDYPQDGTIEQLFLSYLRVYRGLILLTRNSEIKLKPNIVFVSPFRNAGGDRGDGLRANLSTQSYVQELRNISRTTSKSSMSLIPMASTFFGEKRRKLEADFTVDRKNGWNADADVIAVGGFLERIGYKWSLSLIDQNKNIYEIKLDRNGKQYLLSNASAGEIEMINYIFGLHALKLESGLIIIDEPELHLHPKWIRLLLDVFMELSTKTGNQFLISTHSPIFINEESYSHIIRIYKDQNDISRCVSLQEQPELNIKDALHIINSTNNEKMFFADGVVMVEGITDRLVFQKIFEEVKAEKNIQKTIEIIEIHGKANREKFSQFLTMLSIPSFFIGDLDNINQLSVNAGVKALFVCNAKKVKEDVVDNPASMDGNALISYIDTSIRSGDKTELEKLWLYILSTRTKLKQPLTPVESSLLDSEVAKFEGNNIYILRDGDIEDYFPIGYKKKDLNNVLKLLSDEEYKKWKEMPGYGKLHDLALKIASEI